jgi:pyruvate dehydrogenase E1 component
MIPFYIFYSMFGFQHAGDQMWASCDSMGPGFLLAATAGRTTLNGEGLSRDQGNGRRPGQAALGFGLSASRSGANRFR